MDSATALIKRLEAARDETVSYYGISEAELAQTYGPGKWSVRCVLLHHLADSETVLYDRICRIISEPRQVLWVFDENAWAKGRDYATLPLALSRPVYESVRAANIHHVRQHYEAKGQMEFVHSVTGVRTLKDEMDKVASHNEHHLAQIRTALGR